MPRRLVQGPARLFTIAFLILALGMAFMGYQLYELISKNSDLIEENRQTQMRAQTLAEEAAVLAKQSDTARLALCAHKTNVAHDIARHDAAVRRTEKLLAENPNGIGGISPRLFRAAIRDEKAEAADDRLDLPVADEGGLCIGGSSTGAAIGR